MTDLTTSRSQSRQLLFEHIDFAIRSAREQSNPQLAVQFGRALLTQMQLRGVGLAKFLYDFRCLWEEGDFARLGIADERFEDMIQATMDIRPQTTRKWADLWENIFLNPSVPETVKEQLYDSPIKTLNLLSAAVRDGELNEEQLKRVAGASEGEVRDMVRQARGEQTSSASALVIYLSPAGTLYCYTPDGERLNLGAFNLDMRGDPLAKKALTRIIERAGIIEK